MARYSSVKQIGYREPTGVQLAVCENLMSVVFFVWATTGSCHATTWWNVRCCQHFLVLPPRVTGWMM
jgi:hypothetical protein